MQATCSRIAVTTGEPAGIGPELCASLATRPWQLRPVLIGDRALIAARAACARLTLDLVEYRTGAPLPPEGAIEVIHLPLASPAPPGQVDPANARYVLATLDRAVSGCLCGEFAAMVTAPVHKAVINDAGIAFSGHTEYLAERTGAARVVMMLVGGGMRVALVTTHLPLSAVAGAITPTVLTDTLRIVHRDLERHFGLRAPRIVVTGLNPHAGEGGHMGREEIEVIAPVLDLLRGEGFDLIGPLPADTVFVPERLRTADAVLAMYHDQGLPVLKHASFGGGVNVTLGLPIIRTSVDHGTALELAGRGCADPGSLHAALELATAMATHRALAREGG